MGIKLYEKLQAVQSELKAPKGQFNKFGNYKYRSCEDILEAAKPVLAKHKAVIVVSDDIVVTGERYYVRATVEFIDAETGERVVNTAFAREAADKKGMDDSQITGTASSYARKYALGGLLLIDDTKDADTNEHHDEQENKEPKEAKESTSAGVAKLVIALNRTGYDPTKLMKMFKLEYDKSQSLERNLARLTPKQIENAIMGVSKTEVA